jgi:leucyl aminopeptidase
MMDVGFSVADVPQSGALVVLVGPDGALSGAAARADELTGGLVRRALAQEPGGARHGGLIDLRFPAGSRLDHLLLLVAGKEERLGLRDLEELGGTLAQKIRALKLGEVTVASSEGLDLGQDATEVAACLALGARLRGHRFTKYRTGHEPDEPATPQKLGFIVADPEAPALRRVAAVADAVGHARDLMHEPANVLNPEAFAEACVGLEAQGIEVEVLDRDALERIGMRALLGVAQGSANAPYVAIMRWNGGGLGPPLALVGKGVCFDTGGISIKGAAGMEDMKFDMGGAAAVFGAMKAAAGRKARANLVGVVGLVENMPSGTAQRPGDVVRALSGKTIEVINTDAEGRLVLADILWYTQDRFKPAAMIDLATLTGAVVVALGHENAGLFANDDELAARLLAAGERTGETLWRLPLGKAYEKHIKSDIADIKNVGRAREAGSTAGAVFVQQFVNDVPWAHLDIAGTAWSSRDQPLAGKGATGFGVRLLDALIGEHYEAP